MLDLNMLKSMPPDTVFAQGHGVIEGLTSSPVSWIAIRGDIHDWAIYYHLYPASISLIMMHGEKVSMESNVRLLVPCDEESFKMYRF
jgi:hypothetical protein